MLVHCGVPRANKVCFTKYMSVAERKLNHQFPPNLEKSYRRGKYKCTKRRVVKYILISATILQKIGFI